MGPSDVLADEGSVRCVPLPLRMLRISRIAQIRKINVMIKVVTFDSVEASKKRAETPPKAIIPQKTAPTAFKIFSAVLPIVKAPLYSLLHYSDWAS